MDLNPSNFPIFVLVISLWSLLWKGIATWRAAKLDQRNWFIAMLVLNTIGILEIIYLFRFSKKRLSLDEIKSWKNIFEKK